MVDIGGPFKATLPALSFENATRRNRRARSRAQPAHAPFRCSSPSACARRPNLVAGSLVYARVESAPRDVEPTLSCVDAAGKSAGMGPLLGGLPFSVSTGAARALLARPPCAALATLGAAASFELAVGVNGRCWVSAPDVGTTILVAQALTQAATLPPAHASSMVAAMLAQHADAKA